MSVEYTIYDPATTEIIVSGEFSPETMQLHAMQPGREFMLDVAGDPATQYVAGGELVSYTPEEAAARAAMPAGWVWQMPERIAVDARALADVIAAHVAKIDGAAHAARAQILAYPTNAEEYHPAAADAAAFRDAGFTGPVPRGVSGWAYAKRRKGWTAQQAAEDILSTAARWDSAKWFIRDHRLDLKELVRDATTTHEADLLLEIFLDGLTAAMQGVQ